jgi:hypothetical protein
VTEPMGPETGDRAVPPGSQPILVDTSQEHVIPSPQGDAHAPGSVSLVRDDQRPTPTAGEYRALGYVVPEHDGGPVPDDQTPGLVYADQRAPQGTVTFATSAMAQQAAVPAEAAPEPESDGPPPPDDSPADPETPEALRADEVAERAGRQAAAAPEPRSANPHDRRTTQGKAWDRGWDSAQSS